MKMEFKSIVDPRNLEWNHTFYMITVSIPTIKNNKLFLNQIQINAVFISYRVHYGQNFFRLQYFFIFGDKSNTDSYHD